MGYLNPHTHPLDTPTRPRVVVLCGSTRFKDDFERVNRTLTLGGHIVVAPGVFGHADGIELTEASKTALDALHLRKIDLADEVIVVNPGGYIGDSTRREIAYAKRVGKPIGYTDGEPRGTCHYCGPTDNELRPYGPGGSTVCFPCATASPEREQAAQGSFAALLDMTSSVGLTAIGTEAGPINVDAEDIEALRP